MLLRKAAMPWIALWVTVSTIGLLGLIASFNSARFARRVAAEIRELWANTAETRIIDRRRLEGLPAPARRYLAFALGDRERAVRAVRFRHGGRFRTKLDGPWQEIQGQQYEAADAPGFLWWGRLRVGPGLWVDALDRSLNSAGGMFVSFESTVPLFDRAGPELDQGALLRLLSDLVLFPTAFLDERHVTWSAISDTHARASLCVRGLEVAGVFEFGDDRLPRAFFADRYLDTGSGQAQLTPWSGTYADYREAGGMIVPHRFVGYWHLDGKQMPYADFQIETPEYDVMTPF